MRVSRRHFFLGSLALPVLGQKKPVERPNLLLILVDNLPSWVLGSSGNKEFKTPALDRLAQTGTRFLNHTVASPVPGLSRATILTGRTPMQLGDTDNPSVSQGSLTSILSAVGFDTKTADSPAAADAVGQQSPGKPFFLTVGCPTLTPPYDHVPQKYRDLYAQTKFDTLNLPRTVAPNARDKGVYSDLLANVRRAAAAVSSLDDDVTAIFAKLSERRLLDSTAVVLTSSCGALLGRHGLWGAGLASDPVNMYEETVNTPLIWSWPGRVPAQSVRPEMVSTYDFVPTVCDLMGVSPPSSSLCGRSYLLLVTGKPLPKKQPWRKTIFGHYQNTDLARVERYKLISRDEGKGPGELYDLAVDRAEATNQYANPQFLTVRQSLADSLATWKQKYS
jgi:arylsulfatase A-like enzyme